MVWLRFRRSVRYGEIRVLFVSVASALRALIWMVVAQVLLMYIFALVLVDAVSSYLLHMEEDRIDVDVKTSAEEHWGSLGRAMLTLYESVTGGAPWRTVVPPLKAAGPFLLRTLTGHRRTSKCFLQYGGSVDLLAFVKFFAMGSSVFPFRREVVLDCDCFKCCFLI